MEASGVTLSFLFYGVVFPGPIGVSLVLLFRGFVLGGSPLPFPDGSFLLAIRPSLFFVSAICSFHPVFTTCLLVPVVSSECLCPPLQHEEDPFAAEDPLLLTGLSYLYIDLRPPVDQGFPPYSYLGKHANLGSHTPRVTV